MLILINGHLKVYIEGTLVFDGYVDDDLSQVIFEIIEKYLGNTYDHRVYRKRWKNTNLKRNNID